MVKYVGNHFHVASIYTKYMHTLPLLHKNMCIDYSVLNEDMFSQEIVRSYKRLTGNNRRIKAMRGSTLPEHEHELYLLLSCFDDDGDSTNWVTNCFQHVVGGVPDTDSGSDLFMCKTYLRRAIQQTFDAKFGTRKWRADSKLRRAFSESDMEDCKFRTMYLTWRKLEETVFCLD